MKNPRKTLFPSQIFLSLILSPWIIYAGIKLGKPSIILIGIGLFVLAALTSALISS